VLKILLLILTLLSDGPDPVPPRREFSKASLPRRVCVFTETPGGLVKRCG
jgi:hypothetical protein